MSRQSRLLTAGLVGTLLLSTAACSSDSAKSVSAGSAAPSSTAAAPITVSVGATPAPAPTDVTTAPAATTPPANVPAAATNPPAQAGGKVNINDASTSDLETAFKAAGVSNARRWAQEVDEYRPYPTDPDFAKLRQELGKYNIDPKVLDLILSTLEF